MQTKVDASRNLYAILNWLRKRRTVTLKLIIPLLLIENFFQGKKPNEIFAPHTSMTAIVGVILIYIGALLRVWARGHFIKGRLFTTGPYAFVRHPLYLGSSLILLGVVLQLNAGWVSFIAVLVFSLLHIAAILYEENALAKRFGIQWQQYQMQVPALIPFTRGLPSFGRLGHWSWQTFRRTPEIFTLSLVLVLPWTIELWAKVHI